MLPSVKIKFPTDGKTHLQNQMHIASCVIAGHVTSFRLIKQLLQRKVFPLYYQKIRGKEHHVYISARKIPKRDVIKNEEKQLKEAQKFLRKHNHVFCYLSLQHK